MGSLLSQAVDRVIFAYGEGPTPEDDSVPRPMKCLLMIEPHGDATIYARGWEMIHDD